MNNILIIAKGSKYVEILSKDYRLLEGRNNVTVYTDKVEDLKKITSFTDIREYKPPTFRYFDKYYLTYLLTKEKKAPVLYIDVGRLNVDFYRTLFNFKSEDINDIYTNSSWDGIESAKQLYNQKSPYLEAGYFNNILDYFESEKINLSSVVPLLERVFIFPFNNSIDIVIEELEKLRKLFESNSINKKNVYSGVGNGEGLALGYALVKTNAKSFYLRDVPVSKKLLTSVI